MRRAVGFSSLRAHLRQSQSLLRKSTLGGPRPSIPTRGGDVRSFSSVPTVRYPSNILVRSKEEKPDPDEDVLKEEESPRSREQHEHAVISAFDLFSIGGMFVIYTKNSL